MDLRKEILKEHTRAQRDRIVEWVGDSQLRFDHLFELFLNDEYRVVQRASWPVSICVENHPAFINNKFSRLIKKLKQPELHDAVKRNTMRLLQFVTIPKKYQGAIMNQCFAYLSSASEAVAIKVFSMGVLGNLSKLYPEIIPEIKLLIEEQMPRQTAGFKSRAKHLLQEFEKR